MEKGLRKNGRGLWWRCLAEGPQGPDFALSNVAMTAAAETAPAPTRVEGYIMLSASMRKWC